MPSLDFPAFDARDPLDFGMRVVVPHSVAEQIVDEGIFHINEDGEPEVVEAAPIAAPESWLRASSAVINLSADPDH